MGGDFVLIREVSKRNPTTTINIVLSPIQDYGLKLAPPQIISPNNNWHFRNNNIIIKYKTVPNAYSFQIAFSATPNFDSYDSILRGFPAYLNQNEFSQLIDKRMLKNIRLQNSDKIYWKIRASDGNQVGKWSGVRSFMFY